MSYFLIMALKLMQYYLLLGLENSLKVGRHINLPPLQSQEHYIEQGPDLIDLRRPLEGIILLVLGSWILLTN